jgi:hypothetical protein
MTQDEMIELAKQANFEWLTPDVRALILLVAAKERSKGTSMTEVLKQMYQLLLTEPHAPTVCDQLEVILRQAIADLESQEPVAYINVEKRILEWAKLTSWETPTVVNLPKIPLYIHPPQRTWVGLTDDDRLRLWLKTEAEDVDRYAFAKAVEAAIKELNT